MSSAEITERSIEPPSKKRKLESVSTSSEMANNGSTSHSASQEIDEGLYSRQLYVLGHDAMRRMASSDVLISGLGGLGVEIAKNVILAGVKSVTLHDEALCTIADLSSQFYLTEADVGKNRAEVCCQQLSELNTYVPTRSYTGELTQEFLKKFRVVVLTASTLAEQMRINEITHVNDIAFITADTRGLFAQVFCDFGEEFTVVDTNGEPCASAMVASISKDTEGLVTCVDDTRHGLEDGDYVTFSEVQGMTELNGCKPMKVKILGPYTFSIEDTSSFSEYVRGGIAIQVKMPKVLTFKSLKEAMKNPEYLTTDFAKFDYPPQLHLAFTTLHKFIDKSGKLPRPWNKEDADNFVSFAKSITEAEGNDLEVNVQLLETFAKVSSGSLCPMNATIGGIVAQEIMKASSGKFSPIYQWLYFDAIECLPSTDNEIKEEDCVSNGSRYDGQTAVFGRGFQEKLGSYKSYLILSL